MNIPACNIQVLVGDNFACVKVSGRANFNSSVDFKTLLEGLQRKGFKYFVIELSECALMDSTFLGVLAGFGLKTSESGGGDGSHTVELRNANARVAELLENLGVLGLFKMAQGTVGDCTVDESAAHSSGASREEITRACLEAHQTLMQINPENVARFKDVTKFLAEDLERLKAKH